MAREYLDRGADIEGEYRYVLWRRWRESNWTAHPITGAGGTFLWVGLNPSTADGLEDDHTVRKIVAFTDLWGGVEARIINPFAIRSRHPKALKTHPEPIGPRNDEYIARETGRADAIILCWGSNADPRRSPIHTRCVAVWRSILNDPALEGTPIWHLGLTTGGQPKHPLMLAYATTRKETDVGDLPK